MKSIRVGIVGLYVILLYSAALNSCMCQGKSWVFLLLKEFDIIILYDKFKRVVSA